MDMLGYLLFGRMLRTGKAEWRSAVPRRKYGAVVRLFAKDADVDDNVLVFFEGLEIPAWDAFRQALELRPPLSGVSGRKVFLRLRKTFETAERVTAGEGEALAMLESETAAPNFLKASFYCVPFEGTGTLAGSKGEILLSAANFESLGRVLDFSGEGLAGEEWVARLGKTLYRRACVPPADFHELLASLPDPALQSVLNAFLSQNLFSLDMLASYVYSMGDSRGKFLDNLSANVRREVYERLSGGNPATGYRWMKQVYYIADRNIFRRADELGVSVPALEPLRVLRETYETSRTEEELARRGVEGWLDEFAAEGRQAAVLANVPRPALTAALTYAAPGTIEKYFSGHVSKNGLALLADDVQAAAREDESVRIKRLAAFFRACKDLHYDPLVAETDFESGFFARVTDPSALEAVSDETGYATAVFALKSVTDRRKLEPLLRGTFRTIYEDVLSGVVRLKDFDDYSIPACRRETLKAAAILAEEGRI